MKRYLFLLFALFFTLLGSYAQQAVWNQRFQDYFDTYKDVAIEQMLKYHMAVNDVEFCLCCFRASSVEYLWFFLQQSCQ